MTDQTPQPEPVFEVPENPLAPPPAEHPAYRTRPVRRVRPRPEALGEIMPSAAVHMRRTEFDRLARAAIAEDIERTTGAGA